jgi:hypothetical protein
MAMSGTGSSFAQWAGLYDPELSPDCAAAADDGHNNVVATAGRTSPTKVAAAAHQCPGIEGPRVGKPPARRRSRSSRRAPVTLLNTDTANFQAMVQQFTGIPAPPAAAFGGPVVNFAGDYGLRPPAGVRHHHSPAPLHDQLLRRQQQPQYTGGAFGYNGRLLQGAGAGDMFASSAEDRMLLQSMRAAQVMEPAPAANSNTSLGFFA